MTKTCASQCQTRSTKTIANGPPIATEGWLTTWIIKTRRMTMILRITVHHHHGHAIVEHLKTATMVCCLHPVKVRRASHVMQRFWSPKLPYFKGCQDIQGMGTQQKKLKRHSPKANQTFGFQPAICIGTEPNRACIFTRQF